MALTYTIHDQVPHDGNKIIKIYNWLVSKLLADEIIIFSRLQLSTRARTLQFRLGGYQGEKAEICTSRLKAAEPTALFFGRVQPYKGYEYLPAISRPLVADGAKILVAGRGHSKELDAAQKCEGLEIVNRYISDGEAAAMFNSARVSLMPYKEATQSGVLLHAASFGRTHRRFCCWSTRRLHGPTYGGRCVKPGDVDAFSEAPPPRTSLPENVARRMARCTATMSCSLSRKLRTSLVCRTI